MTKMLLRGADGIVPSVGNLVPRLCHELFESACVGDRSKAEQLEKKMMATATLYQRGRTLGQSLAALKAVMSLHGLCSPAVLSPLLPLTEAETDVLFQEMLYLGMAPALEPNGIGSEEKAQVGK